MRPFSLSSCWGVVVVALLTAGPSAALRGVAQRRSCARPLRALKTEAEWRESLTPEEYGVLREAGTERPWSSELNDVKAPGSFLCKGCGAPLFKTEAKFDSGSGWPSFFKPLDEDAVVRKVDFKMIVPRTEVTCKTCEGHLGHVFDDGPAPTRQRYCINGVAMRFVAEAEAPADLAAAVARRAAAVPAPRTELSAVWPQLAINVGLALAFFNSAAKHAAPLLALANPPPTETVFAAATLLASLFYAFLVARTARDLLS